MEEQKYKYTYTRIADSMSILRRLISDGSWSKYYESKDEWYPVEEDEWLGLNETGHSIVANSWDELTVSMESLARYSLSHLIISVSKLSNGKPRTVMTEILQLELDGLSVEAKSCQQAMSLYRIQLDRLVEVEKAYALIEDFS